MRRWILAIDAALLRPRKPRTLLIIHMALVALIGLRLATRSRIQIAERPEALTTKNNALSWLPADFVTAPLLVIIQIIGLIDVGLVLAR